MEYFFGSAITLAILAFVYNKIEKDKAGTKKTKLRFRQSHIYSIVAPIRKDLFFNQKRPKTQSVNHLLKRETRVVLYENKAYWIADNRFYTADIIDGNIDQNSKKVVDTIGVDKVELDKLSIIVEKLTEESIDDNRNPGNEKFF